LILLSVVPFLYGIAANGNLVTMPNVFVKASFQNGEKMPKCWNCGAEVPEQATFCPQCGKTFAATPPGGPQPSQPYGPQPNQNQPFPGYPYPPMPASRLEQKVDSLRKLVLAVLILQVFFVLLLFV
jgi:hypothetical protein